jgi:hypothetical protein
MQQVDRRERCADKTERGKGDARRGSLGKLFELPLDFTNFFALTDRKARNLRIALAFIG